MSYDSYFNKPLWSYQCVCEECEAEDEDYNLSEDESSTTYIELSDLESDDDDCGEPPCELEDGFKQIFDLPEMRAAYYKYWVETQEVDISKYLVGMYIMFKMLNDELQRGNK